MHRVIVVTSIYPTSDYTHAHTFQTHGYASARTHVYAQAKGGNLREFLDNHPDALPSVRHVQCGLTGAHTANLRLLYGHYMRAVAQQLL